MTMRAWVTVYENKSKLTYVCMYIYIKKKMCVFYTSNTYFYSPI